MSASLVPSALAKTNDDIKPRPPTRQLQRNLDSRDGNDPQRDVFATVPEHRSKDALGGGGDGGGEGRGSNTSILPEDASALEGAREIWPELYEQDQDFAAVWCGTGRGGAKGRGHGERVDSYEVRDGLVWQVRAGCSGRRLCVPRAADKVAVSIYIVYERYLACWLDEVAACWL